MNIETIKAVGAVVGLIGGILTLGERIVTFRNKRSDQARTRRKRKLSNVSALAQRSGIHLNLLLKEEIFSIIAFSVLINFLALSLSTRLTSILYLDMTGTAIAALLLGPWYGAIVGLLSNGVVNWILFPGSDADIVVFPWAIVNMCGGLLWGYFGRNMIFTRFMASENAGLPQQIFFLFKFGVLGAAVMAIPGTAVQAAMGQKAVLALDPEVATALDRFVVDTIPSIKAILDPVFSEPVSSSVARWAVCWVQNTARYIPDKTLSFAIAIVTIKSAFPLYERELIHTRANSLSSEPKWLDASILLVLLIPYTAELMFSTRLGSGTNWRLWIAPIVATCFGTIFELMRRPRLGVGALSKEDRKLVYKRANELLPRDAAARPGPNFALACLAASLLFVLVLPILVTNYLRIAFNFLCLVYGFQLALYLYCIAIGQNLSIRTWRTQSARHDAPKIG